MFFFSFPSESNFGGSQSYASPSATLLDVRESLTYFQSQRRPFCFHLFHHQTTTFRGNTFAQKRCISSYFIIKPQRSRLSSSRSSCCISSYFIIKPQLTSGYSLLIPSCISSYFIIKPQQVFRRANGLCGCISSYFIIKPQLHADG